jgi:hypothetical protein
MLQSGCVGPGALRAGRPPLATPYPTEVGTATRLLPISRITVGSAVSIPAATITIACRRISSSLSTISKAWRRRRRRRSRPCNAVCALPGRRLYRPCQPQRRRRDHGTQAVAAAQKIRFGMCGNSRHAVFAGPASTRACGSNRVRSKACLAAPLLR